MTIFVYLLSQIQKHSFWWQVKTNQTLNQETFKSKIYMISNLTSIGKLSQNNTTDTMITNSDNFYLTYICLCNIYAIIMMVIQFARFCYPLPIINKTQFVITSAQSEMFMFVILSVFVNEKCSIK